MAKQVGPTYVIGTINGITFYKMYNTYFARMKSSLSRKKVLTSPRFALTRMHANQLAEASKIASQLYKTLPKDKRDRPIYRSFVGKAKVLLAQGIEKEVVIEILRNELFPKPKTTTPKQIKKKKPIERTYISKRGKLIWREVIHPVPHFIHSISQAKPDRNFIDNESRILSNLPSNTYDNSENKVSNYYLE